MFRRGVGLNWADRNALRPPFSLLRGSTDLSNESFFFNRQLSDDLIALLLYVFKIGIRPANIIEQLMRELTQRFPLGWLQLFPGYRFELIR